ncbi:MAG TPA: hypothetical protein VFT49_03235 [Candidatus Saccharimonadales bacterium]|nr:hypothetical protein [Candidatus Saccharimonadales bacterium]
MSGYAIDGLVIERCGREVSLVNVMGAVPNPASVGPIRREFAKVMGMHPKRVVGPSGPDSTGSVTVLTATVPEHREDDAELTIWEIIARKGNLIEPQLTKTSPSNFGSRRRRAMRSHPHETPLPRLTSRGRSCGHLH